MKKTIFLLVVVLGFSFVATQSWAQEKGQIRAGGGLALGSKSALSNTGASALGVGINFGGDYFVTDIISISPSYTFFFKSTYSETISGTTIELSIKTSSFNIDGKYYFLTEAVNVYGLLGLSIASAEVTFDFFGTPISASSTDLGINIGGGADYVLSDKMYLNGQLKYNSPLEQIVINLGVGFILN